jgi:hypothetical protein
LWKRLRRLPAQGEFSSLSEAQLVRMHALAEQLFEHLSTPRQES